eukprot:4765678-Ditylum_brightwellii.AAC.1
MKFCILLICPVDLHWTGKVARGQELNTQSVTGMVLMVELSPNREIQGGAHLVYGRGLHMEGTGNKDSIKGKTGLCARGQWQ